MNNEELHQFANDFRRLRADLIDRSNQILSMVEMALKRSAVTPVSSEQFSYLDYGIRITEGDYVRHTESSQQLPHIALFAELDKRPMARSLGASQAASLNEAGMPITLKSKKLLEPLKRSLTASQKLFARNRPAVSQGEHAESRNSLKKTESSDAAFSPPPIPHQSLMANDQPKNAALSAFAALKSQLSFVNEAMSSPTSSLFAEPPIPVPSSSDGPPVSKRRTEILAGNEPESVETWFDQTLSPKQETRFLPLNTVAIEFGDYVVPRRLHSASSSLEANASLNSLTPLASPSTSEFPRKSSFRRSISLKDSPGIIYPPHASPYQKRGSSFTPKQETPFSLVTPDPHSRGQSTKIETPKTQTPTLLEYLFLFPAYDNKGRRLTVESLAAYGKIDAVFRVNGIHPRSLFSNVWDMAMGSAYNPSYNLFDMTMLSIATSSIFLCDSMVVFVTPQLVRSDISFFDLSEYEKARPTLPVWMLYWMKRAAGDGRDELFMGRIAAALHYIPGDYVTKQGDSGSDMYFILNGKAEVYVNERHAVTLGAGAYFGGIVFQAEVGLIMKTLRTATVQAVLPSLMYRLTYLDFHKILDDFTDMRIRIDMLAEERERMIQLEEMNR
ncbi:hypothetical protein HDU80_004662 [Chytriomyces hyalinus]|nr:hypothetical protein HDU80_004662 [Chytriomyces hyalinus]